MDHDSDFVIPVYNPNNRIERGAPRDLDALFGGARFRTHQEARQRRSTPSTADVAKYVERGVRHMAYAADGGMVAFARLATINVHRHVWLNDGDTLDVAAYRSFDTHACIVGAAFVGARTLCVVTSDDSGDESLTAWSPATNAALYSTRLAAAAAAETVDALSGSARDVLMVAVRAGQSERTRLEHWRVTTAAAVCVGAIDVGARRVRNVVLSANGAYAMARYFADDDAVASALYDVDRRALLRDGTERTFAFSEDSQLLALLGADARLCVLRLPSLELAASSGGTQLPHAGDGLCFVGRANAALLVPQRGQLRLWRWERRAGALYDAGVSFGLPAAAAAAWQPVKRPGHNDFALRGGGACQLPLFLDNVDGEEPATLALFRAALLVFTLRRSPLADALILQRVAEAVAGDARVAAALSDVERTRIFTAARVTLQTRRQRAHLAPGYRQTPRDWRRDGYRHPYGVFPMPPPDTSPAYSGHAWLADLREVVATAPAPTRTDTRMRLTRYLRRHAPAYARHQLEPLGALPPLLAAERAADIATALLVAHRTRHNKAAQRVETLETETLGMQRRLAAARLEAGELAQQLLATRTDVDAAHDLLDRLTRAQNIAVDDDDAATTSNAKRRRIEEE